MKKAKTSPFAKWVSGAKKEDAYAREAKSQGLKPVAAFKGVKSGGSTTAPKRFEKIAPMAQKTFAPISKKYAKKKNYP